MMMTYATEKVTKYLKKGVFCRFYSIYYKILKVISLLPLIFSGINAQAQEQNIVNISAEWSFTIPENYTEITKQIAIKELVFAMIPKQVQQYNENMKFFPNFNIIQQAGKIEISPANLRRLADRTIWSIRSTGLTNAQLLDSQIRLINNTQIADFHIRVPIPDQQDSLIISSLVQDGDNHLILTYTSKGSFSDSTLEDYNKIISGLVRNKPLIEQAVLDTTYPKRLLSLIAGILTALLLLLFLVRRGTNSVSKTHD